MFLTLVLEPEHGGVGDDPHGVRHVVDTLHLVLGPGVVPGQPEQVDEGQEDEGGGEEGLGDGEEAPGDQPVPGTAVLAHLKQGNFKSRPRALESRPQDLFLTH